ncbi:MAG: transglutaminase-like domain-containing protein, partial [Planctomycetota bacterium]
MTPNRRTLALALPLLLLWSSSGLAQSDAARGIKRSRPQEKCVVASWRLLTPVGRGAEDVHAYFFLPQDGVQQKVQILRFSPEPNEIITDKYGRKIAHFIVPRMEESRHVAVRWIAKVKIHHLEARVKIDPASPAGKITDEIRKLYLVDKPYYGIHSEYIRDLVAKIAPPEVAPLDRVRKIFRHLGENLRYELAGGWDTAETVLRRGTGSCSEYTYCFIALCRASGIP